MTTAMFKISKPTTIPKLNKTGVLIENSISKVSNRRTCQFKIGISIREPITQPNSIIFAVVVVPIIKPVLILAIAINNKIIPDMTVMHLEEKFTIEIIPFHNIFIT